MIEDGDEELYPPTNGVLRFQDIEQPSSVLSQLNTLRKDGLFCDLVLEVEGHEIQAHKCVMACTSQYLYEILMAEEQDCKSLVSHCKLKGFNYEDFEILINYAYTSKLEVPQHEVKGVYKVAKQLKMTRVAEACSQYLSTHLSPTNCIGIRAFANSNSDESLTSQTDNYIQTNFTLVQHSPEFLYLPRIQVEIIGAVGQEMNPSNEQHVSQLVVDWIQSNVEQGMDTDSLVDIVNLFYLDTDNTLRDCQDLQDSDLENVEVIQDYKKSKNKKNKQQNNKQKGAMASGKKKSPPRIQQKLPKHLRLSSEDLVEEKEWKLIANCTVSNKSMLCVAVLDSTLMTICIRFRQPSEDSNPNSGRNSPNDIMYEKQASLTPLAPMNSPRCGVGTAVLDGKLIALGGYDRGECLKTVESYDLHTNQWKAHSLLNTPRGRFDTCQLGGKLYACGGSDGIRDLNTVEMFDPDKGKWCEIAPMFAARSSPGVATLAGKLYCVGGWSGQTSIVDCEVYDPSTNKWSSIAKLNIARSQAAVCSFDGKLYAIGGCTSWNCINSVEVYSPEDDVWTSIAPINICRRGAGVAVFGGKLYLVGGSDGSSSLASLEVYDPASSSWSFGPSLKTCRANVGVAVLGSRLFALGGFSGKAFLDSLEFCDLKHKEWWGYLPQSINDIVTNGQDTVTNGQQNGLCNGSHSMLNGKS